MRPISRRGFGALVAGLALTGCGFQPVYTSRGSAAGAAETGLAEVEVLLIPERNGQLLRQALQTRFERGGNGIARRYDLAVALGISGEAIAIQRDSTSSRVRIIGSANWTLYSQGPTRQQVTKGYARDVEGYDIIDQQYFAADLQSEAVQRRMMDALAEQVTLQLASWFHNHPPA